MKTIRSFIAIPLAPDVCRAAGKLLRRLSEPDDGIKWVPNDNLHLTLKFLGDVDNTQVPLVCNVIRDVCESYEPFGLMFGGTGGFPGIDRPRVLYAGVEDPSGSLTGMVTQLESGLAELGFKPEPRVTRPTSLWDAPDAATEPATKLSSALQRDQTTELGSMQVDTVQLLASFLDKKGPTYQVMDTIRL